MPDNGVVVDIRETVVEGLRRLRKGRGIFADDLDDRVRPEFAELFGASEDTGSALRDKLVEYLEELAVGLPGSLQRAASLSLNLPPAERTENLQQRLERLAEELYCDDRTARRRMDEAFDRMADYAARGGGPAAGGMHTAQGWYVDVFDAVLRLDLDHPEAIERRTIVATAATLDRVETAVDVPRHPHREGGGASGVTGVSGASGVSGADGTALVREIVFGGIEAGRGRDSSTHFRTTVLLPRTLRKGDRHTYGIMARIPPGQTMVPRYVYVPYGFCRYFTLLVRFHPDRLPGRVWTHNGSPHSAVNDGLPGETLLVLDRANEVRAEFRNLVSGCAYGIQWQ